MNHLQPVIEKAWENRELLQETETTSAIREVIDLLDEGKNLESLNLLKMVGK